MWPFSLAIGAVVMTGLIAVIPIGSLVRQAPVLGPLYALGGTWAWMIDAGIVVAAIAGVVWLVPFTGRALLEMVGANRLALLAREVGDLRDLRGVVVAAAVLLAVALVCTVIGGAPASAIACEVAGLAALAILLANRPLLGANRIPFAGLVGGAPARNAFTPVIEGFETLPGVPPTPGDLPPAGGPGEQNELPRVGVASGGGWVQVLSTVGVLDDLPPDIFGDGG
jgi:hypothetical protein